MPAAIAISKNQQDFIKLYLQETYDITIVDAFDCQTLSDAIYIEKAISISCSTLRRLFDLVPNTNAQSRFILNAMAVAVGFKNWDVFKTHVAGFDTNMINQNIQIYSRQLPTSDLMILETITNLPITNWLGGYQLQSIISIAIENKDFELLDSIVRIPFEIDKQAVYEHLVIAFQSLYFQSIKGNNDVIAFVEKNIAHSIVLQKCLLQAYVDERHLDGFLGLWFYTIQENCLPDLLLFKNLLLCQKAFVIEKDITKAKQIVTVVNEQVATSTFDIHPILKARIGVWELILNRNPKILNDYFNSLQNPFDIADFAVIASRLFWIYHSATESIPFLDKINCENFPVVKNYFQGGRYNVLLLTLAINHYLKQETTKAKSIFKLVDSNTFAYDIVNIDFYIPWMERLSLSQK
jgi:hypothetical protein